MREALSKAMPSENGRDGQPLAGPTLYRIQFVEQAAADQAVLVEFKDPAPRKAVQVCAALDAPPADSANPDLPAGQAGPDVLEIVAVPWAIRGGAANCRTGSPRQRSRVRRRPSWSRSATPW